LAPTASEEALIDALCPPMPPNQGAALPVVDETVGPGGCKLSYEKPVKRSRGVEAILKFSVPGAGAVHQDRLLLENAEKRGRFIKACIAAVKGTNAAPNENDLSSWLEKRLLALGKEAELMTQVQSVAQAPPGVEGKQKKDAVALLKDSSLLYRVGQSLKASGFVGAPAIALILYLALTSRLLDKILSCAIKSESSAGKSFVVESILKFFPAEAYHFVSGMSQQAMVYSDQSFKNKMIVVAEAAGMEKAEFNLRTLLSEGRLIFVSSFFSMRQNGFNK
jgi:hypothetical protein